MNYLTCATQNREGGGVLQDNTFITFLSVLGHVRYMFVFSVRMQITQSIVGGTQAYKSRTRVVYTSSRSMPTSHRCQHYCFRAVNTAV